MTSPVSSSRQDQAATTWSSLGTCVSGGGAASADAVLLAGRASVADDAAAAAGSDTPNSAPTGSSPSGPSLAGLVTAPVRHNRRRPARRLAGSALLADDRGLPLPSADGPVMGFM